MNTQEIIRAIREVSSLLEQARGSGGRGSESSLGMGTASSSSQSTELEMIGIELRRLQRLHMALYPARDRDESCSACGQKIN